jgi:antibiotic biosynthesis monooxygenase (ABM) superfamily enzyme
MTVTLTRKALLSSAAALALFAGGLAVGNAAARFGQPKTVIHVITIKLKPGVTDEQVKAALQDGVQTLAGKYPGIKNIWTRSIKVQGEGYSKAIAMEFESEEALKKYAGSDAQKEWYKVYQPIREESTTHDITN